MHAVKGTRVFCGHEGSVEVEHRLWIDRAEIDLDACERCAQLEHRRGGADGALLAVYEARSSRKDRDLLAHIRGFEPAALNDDDYRIDVARVRVGDGIGNSHTIWRRDLTDRRRP